MGSLISFIILVFFFFFFLVCVDWGTDNDEFVEVVIISAFNFNFYFSIVSAFCQFDTNSTRAQKEQIISNFYNIKLLTISC